MDPEKPSDGNKRRKQGPEESTVQSQNSGPDPNQTVSTEPKHVRVPSAPVSARVPLPISKQKEKKSHGINLKMISFTGLFSKRGQDNTSTLQPSPELRTFAIKLGWVQGVLIPCLLNIWGVMLFLRIAWVVGQAGIGFTLLIIAISSFVCVITTLSLSAICTNGIVQGGGVYYLVSRSLGAELGGSVGIIFAFANAVAASMNTIGFCDSLNDLLRSHNLKILDSGDNDVRIVGSVALFLMCLICAIGMDWETKTQNFLIAIILMAMANYVLGVIIGPRKDRQQAEGFVGVSADVGKENWGPDFRYSEDKMQDFFSVFAIYFPAVTGIQSGANICGDLKDPATAIPKGTILAIIISTSSYLMMAICCGMGALRDASGSIDDLDNGNLTKCVPNCKYGLHNNYEMMQVMSAWSLLIFFGCWAATLSTALTNLLAVPRLLQALGKDRIYPGLSFFAKPYGRHGEPYRAYVLTFIISCSFLLIAQLNIIAPLITNFYLASYSLINLCTFHADFVRNHNWRPQFKYFNKWLSLLGFALCISIMVVISWYMSLATILIFFALYMLVHARKLQVNWGSSTEAQHYRDTITYLLQQTQTGDFIKSYQPQLLIVDVFPQTKPQLLEIGHYITRTGSFMIVADYIEHLISADIITSRRKAGQEWLNEMKYRGLFVVIDGHNMRTATRALLQCTGLGHMSPNIILLNYLEAWYQKPTKEISVYIGTLQVAMDYQLALAIFRSRSPSQAKILKKNKKIQTDDSETLSHGQMERVLNKDSNEFLAQPKIDQLSGRLVRISEEVNATQISPPKKKKSKNKEMQPLIHEIGPRGGKPPKRVDAWWLFDDGGLNILLPYIISKRGGSDKHFQFRIFALAKDLDDPQPRMAETLKKFRIEYDELIIISSVWDEPSPVTRELFNQFIQNFKTEAESDDVLITDEELLRMDPKTSRYLKLRELILLHSRESHIVIITLPLPRKGQVSAVLYMAWLEVLSQQMPNILFVRGNTSTTVLAI